MQGSAAVFVPSFQVSPSAHERKNRVRVYTQSRPMQGSLACLGFRCHIGARSRTCAAHDSDAAVASSRQVQGGVA